MFASIDVLDKWLHISLEVVAAVKAMRKAFHVLYQFDLSTETGKQKLQWYKDNIHQVKITIL